MNKQIKETNNFIIKFNLIKVITKINKNYNVIKK